MFDFRKSAGDPKTEESPGISCSIFYYGLYPTCPLTVMLNFEEDGTVTETIRAPIPLFAEGRLLRGGLSGRND